jgi:hypothetical protein
VAGSRVQNHPEVDTLGEILWSLFLLSGLRCGAFNETISHHFSRSIGTPISACTFLRRR